MTDSYCVKCKRRTETVNPKIKKLKNNRYARVGKCKICGINKHTFVKARLSNTGDGLLGKALNLPGDKIPILGDIPLIGKLF